MIYKGCIMKIENDFAIILSDDMQYIKVVKKDGMNIGNQIIFVKDDIYNENKVDYKKISAWAAVIFILFMSINILNIKNNKNMVTAAVVSLDINPSIEFELNKKGIVIKVNDINEEAKEIIDGEIIGKKIEDALYITINNAKEKEYISSQKNSVLISDVILDSSIEDKLNIEEDIQTKLNNDKNDSYIKIVYLKSNKNNMKDAHKNDMSIGKYEAFKEIEKQNTNASMYEVKNMKVNQIFDGSGKIYDNVIKPKKEDNVIEDEKEKQAITKTYEKDKDKEDKDKEKEYKDKNKYKKDKYKKNKYKKDKDKDENDEEDDNDDSKFERRTKYSKNKKYKNNKDKDYDKFKGKLKKHKNFHRYKDDD